MKEGLIKSNKRFSFVDNPNIALGPHNEIVVFLFVLTFILSIECVFFYLFQKQNGMYFFYFILTLFLTCLSLLLSICISIYDEIQKKHIRNFLHSNRIQISWRYQNEEWKKLKKNQWKITKYQTIATSIASFILFSLVGLLVEIFRSFSTNTTINMGGILLFGFGIAFAMTSSKFYAHYRSKTQNIGREIAIGKQEIYYNGDYIRSDNQHWLCDAHLNSNDPHKLIIEVLDTFRENREINQEISIQIPDRILPKVENFLEDNLHSY